MPSKNVADQFVETPTADGAKRIYGIVGDARNGLTDATHRHGKIDWIRVRRKQATAFAAGAEAHLRRGDEVVHPAKTNL
jgi:pyruvate dehydrogenase (quinone)